MLSKSIKDHTVALALSMLFTMLVFYKQRSVLFLLDYSVLNNTLPFKELLLNNFTNTWWHFELFKVLLSWIGWRDYSYQLVFFICILASSFYLIKLCKYYILSILIFVFNPFVYSRIITGQISVVLSYFALFALIHYLVLSFSSVGQKKYRYLVLSVLVSLFIASFQLQFFAFNVMLFCLAGYWFLIHGNFTKRQIVKFAKLGFIFVLLSSLINLYWIIGILSNDNVIGSIDSSHENFFSPKMSQGVPTIVKIIGMWGFWRENGYITTYKNLPLVIWYSLTFIFFILMLIGYYSRKRNDIEHRMACFFYSLWWIGLIFATGISHPITGRIFDFFFEHIPFFSGFRDSHKFVVFICLAYAYLCPLGLMKVKEWAEILTEKLKQNKVGNRIKKTSSDDGG